MRYLIVELPEGTRPEQIQQALQAIGGGQGGGGGQQAGGYDGRDPYTIPPGDFDTVARHFGFEVGYSDQHAFTEGHVKWSGAPDAIIDRMVQRAS